MSDLLPDGWLFVGDVREWKLKPESLYTIATSPPYYGLRSYDVSDLIWDGDPDKPDCEHEWHPMRTARANQGGGETEKQATNVGSFAVPNEDRASYSRLCVLCGAWRGSLGLEPTLALYIQHLVEIFRHLRPALRKDGTLWVNLGSSYAGSGGAHAPHHANPGISKSAEREGARRTGRVSNCAGDPPAPHAA